MYEITQKSERFHKNLQLTKMLRDFEDKTWAAANDLKTVEDWWESLIELDVDDGTDNGDNASLGSGGGGLGRNLK